MNSPGTVLATEMARVRDEIIPLYQSIGANGMMALVSMRADLDQAAKALAEGDLAAMIRIYEKLRGWDS